MQALRQLGGGIVIAIVSIVLVLGGISLAIAESSPPPTQPVLAFVSPTLPLNILTPTLFSLPTFSETPFITETQLATMTFMPPPSATVCAPPPSNWTLIVVGANDTIYTLAQKYATSEDALKNANCLSSVDLQPGLALYVPPVASTAVIVSCSAPLGWVKKHVVQPGENLYRIALSYGLTYPQLQQGNCMGNSTTIYVGQVLWVPNISTYTPIPGATVTVAVFTSTASPTNTSTFIPTATTMPTLTATFISTATPQPTAQPTATNTLPPAPTATPSITPFPSP
jgi:LysM repeat protein